MESKNLDGVTTIARTARNSMCEETIADDDSIVKVRQLEARPPSFKAYGVKVPNSRSEFESLLERSRPCIRASKRPEPSVYASSSVIQTLGWSCLSGISLAEVSNISIIDLALDKDSIWN